MRLPRRTMLSVWLLLATLGMSAVLHAAEGTVIIARECDYVLLDSPSGQILITHGAHNGLVHLLRLTTRPGAPVVFDHPTYPQAIDAILAAGGRAVPVALPDGEGEEGWDVEGLIAACRSSNAAMAYLVLANSLLAMSLLLAMIRAGEVARVSSLFYLVPALAALCSFCKASSSGLNGPPGSGWSARSISCCWKAPRPWAW